MSERRVIAKIGVRDVYDDGAPPGRDVPPGAGGLVADPGEEPPPDEGEDVVVFD